MIRKLTQRTSLVNFIIVIIKNQFIFNKAKFLIVLLIVFNFHQSYKIFSIQIIINTIIQTYNSKVLRTIFKKALLPKTLALINFLYYMILLLVLIICLHNCNCSSAFFYKINIIFHFSLFNYYIIGSKFLFFN